MRYIGVHVSISGGVYRAIERAINLDINTLQIFLKNSNRWNAKPYSQVDIDNFKELLSKKNDMLVFAHSGYLINLAGDGENYDKSISALEDELVRAEQLGIAFLVLHPGSHKGKGIDPGIDKIAHTLQTIYYKKEYSTQILLETTAGQGSSVGHRFEHLQAIINKSQLENKIAVCLDTCHVYSAGYDISAEDNFNKVISTFDNVIGLEKLKLIHLNDSKNKCGSLVDRHEHIGKGMIGKNGFKYILQDHKLKEIPLILETPKFNDDEGDRMNLQMVRSIMDS